MAKKWQMHRGKAIVITGANKWDAGFETAFALAVRGQRSSLAVRNASKGEKAVDRILAVTPKGKCNTRDGAGFKNDLSSIRHFADFLHRENYDYSLSSLASIMQVCIDSASTVGRRMVLEAAIRPLNHIGPFCFDRSPSFYANPFYAKIACGHIEQLWPPSMQI